MENGQVGDLALRISGGLAAASFLALSYCGVSYFRQGHENDIAVNQAALTAQQTVTAQFVETLPADCNTLIQGLYLQEPDWSNAADRVVAAGVCGPTGSGSVSRFYTYKDRELQLTGVVDRSKRKLDDYSDQVIPSALGGVVGAVATFFVVFNPIHSALERRSRFKRSQS